jgi:alginate O-acetyltransferase complex protein AlgI
MLFNSISFIIFLPIVFVLYWLLARRQLKMQNILLLCASYFFYACWDWRFLFLLIFSTVLDFYTGIKMCDASNQKQKKFWFLLSVIINLGFLGFFKYYNFFTESFVALLSNLGLNANPHTIKIILPVGISFYTFHGLSYVIDIYRNRIKAEKNFIDYSVFVCFFPLLVAGPIERATHLLPQIKQKRSLSTELFKEGLLQIALGFFRKIVIADSLAEYVDLSFANPEIYNSTTLVLAVIFYAFQIYYDFAGYSDIAIGTAKLFGFRLLQNFRLPYFSRSITEFWRRWHMSLSFWLRDYLYIELGGNRNGIVKTYRNLFTTMLLGGLWHGSNWTFVVWGGLHGLYLSVEKYLSSLSMPKSLNRFSFLGYFYTFIVVCIAWVFFRSDSIHTAQIFLQQIFAFNFGKPFIGDINVVSNSVLMLLLGLGIDLYLYSSKLDIEQLGSRLSPVVLVSAVTALIIMIVLFFSSSNNFIYFQF